MYILGISAFYHDSAACLIKDGEILSAVQEERYTRKKHDNSFPINSINYCLNEENIIANDVKYIVFYEKPFLKFERILKTSIASAPKGCKNFKKAMEVCFSKKLCIEEIIKNELLYSGEILFPGHHLSHSASAFFPSPFSKSAILTVDGVGEWDTTTIGLGNGNSLDILKKICFPHSLGLLYSAFTYFCGFKVNSGEYKLMGLAPYGEPVYVDLIKSNLIDIKDDGSFHLNMKYFGFLSSFKTTNKKFGNLFNKLPRKPDSEITQKEMDLARSIQEVIEEVMLKMAGYAYDLTDCDNLCLAGGVALNCVSNGRLLRESNFKDIWVQPAAGDAGGAVGAALSVWYQLLKNKREQGLDKISYNDKMKNSYLGPSYSDDEIKKFLDNKKAFYIRLNDEKIIDQVSNLLSNNKVIGWFQGRMEFGPRALGNRSIIADPRDSEMQKKVNLKIKFRESFRPFAPSILRENLSDFFEMDYDSPYMLLVSYLKKEHYKDLVEKEENYSGLEKLKIVRSDIPAVTHVDYSSRIQTVHKETNPKYYALILKFKEKTGYPIILNTSFNVRGEPIVCSPEDAYSCFMRTEMDYLVIGNYLLDKKLQKNNSNDEFINEFEPD